MGEVILKHLTKRFGEVVAVDDVSLFIEDGEFLVLLGPSGCGKSTILRLIAGLEDSSSGEIMIGGKLVNFIDPVRRNVAMVFQNYALYPHMTVYKNIGFPLEMAKKDKATIQQAVTSAAEVLELGDLLQRHPDQLSGGQRQRVALARAIVREPQAFLMDEPLSNLDALLRVQTRVELMRLHQRLRTTTIYVTHDQVEAMTMGHRVVVMQHGVVQQVGKPDDVYNRPANVFVATFIGSPPMNLLPGTLVRDGGGWVFRGDGFSVPIDPVALGVDDTALERAAGEGSKLGVRPESMRLGEPGEAGIPAKIQLLEPVGSDLFLTVEAGPATMQVRTPPETPASPGEAVTLVLPPSKLHVFGPDGRSVRYTEAEAPPAETAIESAAAAPAEQPA